MKSDEITMGKKMSEPQIKNLLLVGMDVTPLARSAKKAGYKVYTVDYFGDQDLKNLADDSFSIIKQNRGISCGRLSLDFDEELLLEGAKRISKRHRIDGILLSTGLDDSPEVLSGLSKVAPIIGNSPQSIQRVRNKERFFSELDHIGAPCPKTAIVGDFLEAHRFSKDVGYPLLVKPLCGFGGAGIRKAKTPQELERIFKEDLRSRPKVMVQEYIFGISASVSVLSSKNGSVALTVNEQLIGLSPFGQEEPFGYCGNIVPLAVDEDVSLRCKRLAERVVTHFGLMGSNGIDLVISRDGTPYIVEVNPRFQGTLECIEESLGINIVKAHIEACTRGLLPKVHSVASKFCTRLILYAPYRTVVPDIGRYLDVRDVPLPGVVVEKGEPLCSIIAKAKARDLSLKKAEHIAKRIIGSLKPIQ